MCLHLLYPGKPGQDSCCRRGGGVLADGGVTEGVPDRCLPFPFFFPANPNVHFLSAVLLIRRMEEKLRRIQSTKIPRETMTSDACGRCVGFQCSQTMSNTKPQLLLVNNGKAKQDVNVLSHAAIEIKGLIQGGKRICINKQYTRLHRHLAWFVLTYCKY